MDEVMKQDEHRISWAHGQFSVIETGAMCAPATFYLNDGRAIQPFAIAPWEDDGSAEFAALPELLKRLRGEWPCVPFGVPETRNDLPDEWRNDEADLSGLGDFFHGPSSNLDWTVIEKGSHAITLQLDYPDTHPIKFVRRRISGDPHGTRLIFELEIMPRKTCALPIGIHPVFRLPQNPGGAHLRFDGQLRVWTYPVPAEPAASLLAEGAVFDSLENVQFRDGSVVDLSQHPLDVAIEDLVLVSGIAGQAVLENRDENYAVTLQWDKVAFPSCTLWISNKGRKQLPWNGRFQAIGIEPVAAPFDLGVAVAQRADTPLARAGVACAQIFAAEKLWTTRYSVEVSSI